MFLPSQLLLAIIHDMNLSPSNSDLDYINLSKLIKTPKYRVLNFIAQMTGKQWLKVNPAIGQ